MGYEVRLERFGGQALAVVRRRAALPQLGPVIQEACGTVWKVIQSQAVKGGRHVAVYLDNEFSLEVGAEVEGGFRAEGEVMLSQLPAGEVATTTHFGPYPGLIEAHRAVQEWCRANGREPVRPCWETYGHWVEEWNKDPGKIRTDVTYLLKS